MCLRVLALCFLLLPFSLLAQTSPAPYTVTAWCLPIYQNPAPISDGFIQGSLNGDLNRAGVCVRWNCQRLESGLRKFQKVEMCGTWGELPKVPGRLATMYKAGDPLKSFNEAGKRFPILPLTDQSMTGMPSRSAPPASSPQ